MKFVQKTHYLTQICWFTIIASGFESFWRKNLTLNFFGIFDLRFKSKSKVAGKNMKFVQKTHYLTQICWFTIIASGFESFWRKNLTLNFFGIFDLRFKSKSKVAGKNMKFVQKTHYLTQICWFTIIASGFESFWRKNLTLNFFGIFDLRFKSKSKVAGKNMKFVQKTHYLTQICWFTIIASGFESFWRKNLTLNFFGIFDLRFKSKSKVAGKNMKFVQKTHYLTQICWFTIIASGFESFWRKNLTLNFFGIFDLRFKSKSKVAGKTMKFVQKTHYLTQICWFTIIASGFESFWRKNLTLNFFGIFDLRFKSKSKVAG